MRTTRQLLNSALLVVATAGIASAGSPPDPAAIERGRVALTQTGHLLPAWKSETYAKVGDLWGRPPSRPCQRPGGLCRGVQPAVRAPSRPLPE